MKRRALANMEKLSPYQIATLRSDRYGRFVEIKDVTKEEYERLMADRAVDEETKKRIEKLGAEILRYPRRDHD